MVLKNFMKKLGFKLTGEFFEGEAVMVLKF